MLVVAVIGLLVTVALPAYQNYFRRAAYSEVLAALTEAKATVVDCHAGKGTLNGCSSGLAGIPIAVSGLSTGALGSLSVTDGTISVTPNPIKGIKATDDCTLAPQEITDGRLVWSYSGGCVSSNYVRN
jgi:Tfp pilus assembly protein PilE